MNIIKYENMIFVGKGYFNISCITIVIQIEL
jgi:hypothetical protein